MSSALELRVELFAQFPDPEHDRLSVVLSCDDIVLQGEGQPAFRICRGSLQRVNELLRRHDAACAAASCRGNFTEERAPAC